MGDSGEKSAPARGVVRDVVDVVARAIAGSESGFDDAVLGFADRCYIALTRVDASRIGVRLKARGETSTDALRALCRRRRVLGRLIEGERLDVGHPLGFVQANVVKALADPAMAQDLREWLTALLR